MKSCFPLMKRRKNWLCQNKITAVNDSFSFIFKKKKKSVCIYSPRDLNEFFFYNVLIEHALLKILKIPLVQGIEYFSLEKNFKMKSMVKIIGPFFKMWSLYIEYHNSLKKKNSHIRSINRQSLLHRYMYKKQKHFFQNH